MTDFFCEETFASAYVDFTCAQETLGASKRRDLSFVLIHPIFYVKLTRGWKRPFPFPPYRTALKSFEEIGLASDFWLYRLPFSVCLLSFKLCGHFLKAQLLVQYVFRSNNWRQLCWAPLGHGPTQRACLTIAINDPCPVLLTINLGKDTTLQFLNGIFAWNQSYQVPCPSHFLQWLKAKNNFMQCPWAIWWSFSNTD